MNAQPILEVGTVRSERPLAELVSELWQNCETLVQKELRLAVAELESRIEDTKRGLVDAAVGGAVLYAGLLAMIAALVLLLSELMKPWLAAALVGAFVIAIGAMLLKNARHRLTADNLKLERSTESLRRDFRTFREAIE